MLAHPQNPSVQASACLALAVLWNLKESGPTGGQQKGVAKKATAKPARSETGGRFVKDGGRFGSGAGLDTSRQGRESAALKALKAALLGSWLAQDSAEVERSLPGCVHAVLAALASAAALPPLKPKPPKEKPLKAMPKPPAVHRASPERKRQGLPLAKPTNPKLTRAGVDVLNPGSARPKATGLQAKAGQAGGVGFRDQLSPAKIAGVRPGLPGRPSSAPGRPRAAIGGGGGGEGGERKDKTTLDGPPSALAEVARAAALAVGALARSGPSARHLLAERGAVARLVEALRRHAVPSAPGSTAASAKGGGECQ